MTKTSDNDVLNKAFDLLSRRSHSTRELRSKLYKRKYPKPDIENAVTECTRLGFLNDELFAADYASELAAQGKGTYVIKLKLRQKGLSDKHIRQALEKLGDHEAENAEYVLQKKLPSLLHETDINKRRQKAYRFLAYRGFSADTISTLIANTPELK